MQHCHVIEAVNRTLRTILDRSNLPFDGITVAWGVGGGELPVDLACGAQRQQEADCGCIHPKVSFVVSC